MKLKDLANQLHVSTAMITRVCQKLGFEGFGEYKAYLKLEEHEQVNTNTFQLEHIFNFFYSVDNEMFYQEIQEAVALIKEARDVIFYGIGLSGILAQYGHGLFNRKGIRSLYIEDFSMRLDFYEKVHDPDAGVCHDDQRAGRSGRSGWKDHDLDVGPDLQHQGDADREGNVSEGSS